MTKPTLNKKPSLFTIKERNEEEVEIPTPCNFIIFNSEDPNRVAITVSKINECLRELREFYWDLEEEVGVELTPENSSKPFKLLAKMDDEKRCFFHQARHINEYIHQLLAPHFICQDIEPKDYNNFMDCYYNNKKYFKAMECDKIDTFYIDVYFEMIVTLFETIRICFKNHGVLQ